MLPRYRLKHPLCLKVQHNEGKWYWHCINRGNSSSDLGYHSFKPGMFSFQSYSASSLLPCLSFARSLPQSLFLFHKALLCRRRYLFLSLPPEVNIIHHPHDWMAHCITLKVIAINISSPKLLHAINTRLCVTENVEREDVEPASSLLITPNAQTINTAPHQSHCYHLQCHFTPLPPFDALSFTHTHQLSPSTSFPWELFWCR